MKIFTRLIAAATLCMACTANASVITSSDPSLLFWYDTDTTTRDGIALSKNQLLGSMSPYNSSAFTVSFYLNITGTESGWGSILHIGNTNNQRWPGFWLTPNNTRLHSRISTSGSWNNGFSDTAPLGVDANEWHHIAMVDDGSNVRLFLDGTVLQTISGANTPYTNADPINVYAGDPWYNPAVGNIDDIRIYNRAVSMDELSRRPQQVSAPSTIALLSLGLLAVAARCRTCK